MKRYTDEEIANFTKEHPDFLQYAKNVPENKIDSLFEKWKWYHSTKPASPPDIADWTRLIIYTYGPTMARKGFE